MDTSIDSIDAQMVTTPPESYGTPKPQGFLMNDNPKGSLTPATMPTQDSPAYSTSSSSYHSFNAANSNILLRMPIPSPSRPRLDPRYAARLLPQPTQQSDMTGDASTNLISPPAVYRCGNPDNVYDDDNSPLMTSTHANRAIFRPSPIIVTTEAGMLRDRCRSSLKNQNSWTPLRPPPKRVKPAKTAAGDRFIPSRVTSNMTMSLWSSSRNDSASKSASSSTDSNINSGTTEGSAQRNLNTFATTAQQNLMSTLMRTEIMGENIRPDAPSSDASGITSNRFRFSTRHDIDGCSYSHDPTAVVRGFNLTPVTSPASERLVTAPSKRKRRISKVPFKVLDAPALQDDFYLNLVDWSSQNVLAVGLGACVYLWSACTSKVTKLCDLSSNEDTVTSVSWAQRGTHLSVGTNKGEVQLWDTIKCKKVRSLTGHTARVGTLAWSGPVLASGSRDRLIYLRDVRVQSAFTDKLSNHRQEVCGLRWSYEEPAFLASGGNDNNLHVIDSRNPNDPLHKFTEHTAAVKAIAWSPHQHGLLASGGGTADRCIRFWNTLSGASLNKIDTGSQVCNIAWSQNCNEIVSTHGYSLNQIVVWRYPSMSKVTTLTGHTYRVLYLAMSPDGSTVVTGAGDETLRFWQIFPGPRSDGKDSAGGLLFPNTIGSVIR
jgi:cell division cycle 20-like protein 1, cofactor of APC complex